MKFGYRTPSINKSIAARTSMKRYVRHNLGFKAPRGYGWITNPRKAAYNRVYNRTTFSLGGRRSGGGEALLGMLLIGAILLAVMLITETLKLLFKIASMLVHGVLHRESAHEVTAAQSCETAENSSEPRREVKQA